MDMDKFLRRNRKNIVMTVPTYTILEEFKKIKSKYTFKIIDYDPVSDKNKAIPVDFRFYPKKKNMKVCLTYFQHIFYGRSIVEILSDGSLKTQRLLFTDQQLRLY
jgi:hypothetical protein